MRGKATLVRIWLKFESGVIERGVSEGRRFVFVLVWAVCALFLDFQSGFPGLFCIDRWCVF